MDLPIIEISCLSKRYRLGEFSARSLREEAEVAWNRLWKKNNHTGGKHFKSNDKVSFEKDFWALKDVSFSVQRGDVVGVIGRNGAGKSTLLKILSRITEPTDGEVIMRGRVASLLEVGTGFHPELSGRDNVYLNGAILGMTKAEITSKFDEIVAFAEIQKFIDTPVKRYSSGMYVRLAFAVAAHLEPEILIVDEVLAVGDQEFQKKCLGKMQDVSRTGRTVIFVSHNMGAVSNLTRKCAFLANGRLVDFGETSAIVQKYVSQTFSKSGRWNSQKDTSHPLQVNEIRLINRRGGIANEFEVRDGFTVELDYIVRTPVRDAVIELWIFSSDSQLVLKTGDFDLRPELRSQRDPGAYTASVRIPGEYLNRGSFYIVLNCGLPIGVTFDHEQVASFEMVEREGELLRSGRGGYLIPGFSWSLQSQSAVTL